MIDLAALSDLPTTRGMHCRLQGVDLALFRVGDEVFAMADSCPHQGASLSNGKLQGYIVSCPAHGLQFDVRTGCSKFSRDLRTASYPVHVLDGRVVFDTEGGAVSNPDE